MFPVEEIAKKNVSGNGVSLVDPPNTMLFHWIVFWVRNPEELVREISENLET